MALAPGNMVGPYEIVGFLAAGGMGEVYRARDARLSRDVAIKTLPASFSGDAERLRRFELEARAASQLSHPNILTVYDIGSADGRPYIVSELLEGETLRERLSRGPIAQKRSAEIAIALADALAAAHRRGIVHRDLKPENLFVTREGRLKILDFGIAKLTSPEPVKGVAASTVHLLTEVGSTVGTPGYMAPEQVRGEPVDHRSDIFALGAILHEMLSGVAVFQRDSRIATLSAVLESNPPDLPDTVAPAVRRIVQRCLEKSPDERFQSARDLAFALNALSDVSVATTGAARLAVGPRRVDWRIAVLAPALGAVLIAGVILIVWPRPTPTPQSLKQFVIQPSRAFSGVDLSPDGSVLAYVMRGANANQIFLRPFARLDEPQPLEGSQGSNWPVFSPDGRWMAFLAGGKLKKLAITGGTPVTLCDAPEYMSASWSNSGHIVFAQRKSGVMRVSAEGGASELVTTVDVAAGEIDHHSPRFLPGDQAVLFVIHAGPDVFRIAVRSLATGEQKTLVDDGFDARYLPSGHLVYARGDTLYAAPFDVSRLEITGPAIAVLERVATEPYNGFAAIAVADDGTLAYVPAVDLEHRSLVWVKRDGTSDPLPTPERAYDSPSLSPDGERLALQISTGPNKNIFVYEFAASTLTRQTQGGIESKAIWTSDGKSLAYASGRGAERSLLMQPLDGSAPPRKLYQTRQDVWPGSWTPDGQSLVFVETPPTEFGDIKIVSAAAGAKAEPLVASEKPEFYPTLSPDGHWLAYTAIDGRSEVYVRPFRGGTSRQVSTDGGTQPRWSRDGRELFYRRGRSMVAVPVRATPELTFGKPQTLFEGVFVFSGLNPPSYDVTADGRFIMIKPSPDELAVRRINVVLHWFDELNRRAPVRR
jgi:eukaryotic-like serine/threonine-protein kinase